MSKVIKLYQSSVDDVLDTIREDEVDMVIAFTMKDDKYIIRHSGTDSITTVLGALTRAMYEINSGSC